MIDLTNPILMNFKRRAERSGRTSMASINPTTGNIMVYRNGKAFELESALRSAITFPIAEIWYHRGSTGTSDDPWQELHDMASASFYFINTTSIAVSSLWDLTDIWNFIDRSVIAWDTGRLSSQPISGYLTLPITSIENTFSYEVYVSLVNFTGNHSNVYSAPAYSLYGTTLLSDDVLPISGMGSTIVFPLNAAGLAYINTAGYTLFGLRLESDRTNVAPSWEGDPIVSKVAGIGIGFGILTLS